MRDWLVHGYLHELAHRLTPGHWHDPAFSAMSALLLIRSGRNRHGRGRLDDLDLYDLQDFNYVDHCSMGEALDWALAQAMELSKTDLSAEACAVEIMHRFDCWKEWKAKTPEREAEALAKADAARQKTAATIRGLQESVERLQQARWEWLAAGIFAGMLLSLALLYLVKGV